VPPQDDLLFWRRGQPVPGHESNVQATYDNSGKVERRPFCCLRDGRFPASNPLLTQRSEPGLKVALPGNSPRETVR
jgi:hypothetical protein